MKEYLEQINSKIKSRTKEQWVEFLNTKLAELRSYISENGEIAFVAAFVLGIFVVVFFKLAFAVFFIAALVFGLVWCLADSEIEIRNRNSTASSAPSATQDPDNFEDENKNPPIQ